MNIFDLEGKANKIPPAKGKLLIATPFLNDPSFSRSAVLLCEHGGEGTIGFVLNQPASVTLGDLVADLERYMPPVAVYTGGPVEPATLHIVHRIPEVLGGIAVAPGIYWGGSFEILQDLVRSNEYREQDMKLFMGYSGWGAGQLDKEMSESTWLIGDITGELMFDTEAHMVWKKAISKLGKNYSFMANIPIDPQLN